MPHGYQEENINIILGYWKLVHLNSDAKVANREWSRPHQQTPTKLSLPPTVYKKIKWMGNLSILIGLNLKTCDLYEDELSASNIIKRLAKVNSSTQLKYSILRNWILYSSRVDWLNIVRVLSMTPLVLHISKISLVFLRKSQVHVFHTVYSDVLEK